MPQPQFQRYKRLNAPHAAGAKAIRVWVCTNPACEVHHERAPPVQCYCGGIQFIRFDSKTEARHWAQLRTLEKRGVISDLRRQVWYKLYAFGPNGERVDIGVSYVCDFVLIQAGVERRLDSKPRAGVDDAAAIKLRIMEAMGLPVEVVTEADIIRGD